MISDKKKAAIDAIDEFKRDILNHFIDITHGNDYEKISLLQIGNIIDSLYEKHVEKIRYAQDNYIEDVAELPVMGCYRNPQAYTTDECMSCEFKDGMYDAYKHATKIYKQYFINQLNNEMEQAKKYDL